MSNNNDFSDDPRVVFPSQSSDDAVNSEENYRKASNSGAANSSEATSLTVEEVEAEVNAILGEDFSDEFKEACQDIFAKAVDAQTADLEEQLEEAEAAAFVLAEQVLTQARELVFQECLQGMAMTDRERLRERVQHIELDDVDTFKTQLLNEKRRMLPYTPKGVHTHGSADALHEINEEDSYHQPTQPTDRLMAASLAAVTKFRY